MEARRELTLSEFIGSLGIDRLGKRRVELMIQAAPGELDTLEHWRAGRLRQPEFAEKSGVPNTGAAIQDGLDAMGALIERMLAAGVVVVANSPAVAPDGSSGTPLKTLCITGKLPSGKKKSDYAAPLEAAGYRLVDAVEAGLDFLVLADPSSTSSKAQKARKLNVTLISEQELERLLERARD